MLSVCIYCGNNKTKALDECGECLKTPQSHTEVIHSIIMSYSEEEPYLNFISKDELEEYRKSIINGLPIKISPDTFQMAEEAFGAVGSLRSPQALKYFSRISDLVIVVVMLLILAFILLGL